MGFAPMAGLREEIIARATLSALSELELDLGDSVVWCYGPDALALLGKLRPRVSAYWTGDEVTLRNEHELLRIVDRVFAISPNALERTKRIAGKRAVAMPMAIDPEPFIKARALNVVPEALRTLPTPLIGYAGAISRRIEWRLLEAVARRGCGTLVLIGPALDQEAVAGLKKITSMRNVKWIGHQDERNAPAHLASLDVGLIPYVRNNFNNGSNPVKFYEYLAAGLPVVSAALPALREFAQFAWFGDDPEAFAAAAESAALRNVSSEERKRRQDVARDHSYDTLISLVDRELDAARSERLVWQPGGVS
jgi:glycosyltransferase involved in cell wall biosynthesis